MLAPAALSLALGLWGVRRGGSMWRDEAVTYDMARRSLPDLWATLGHADAVHGLYYLLLHGLFRVCGWADPLLVLRLPSVLATVVATGTLALLGRRLAGPRAGLLAGVVFALLPPVQRYAQEGRSYAVVCALVVWASYLLLRAVEQRTGRAWAGYGTVMLMACLLHEFAVLALAAHLVALPRSVRRSGIRVALAVCAGLAPLAVLSSRQSDQVAWIGGIGAGALVGFAGVTLLGVVCAAPLRGGRSAGLIPLALPLLILPGLLLILLTPLKALYVDRYVLYGHAGTALLVGAALDRLVRAAGRIRAVTLLAAGATVLALLPVTLHLRTPQSRTDDVAAIARAVSTSSADGIVYLPSRRRVWSLPEPDSVRGLRDLALNRGPADSATLYGTEVAAPVIRARMLAATRILAVGDPAGQPLDRTPQEEAKRQVLADHFEECGTRYLQGARITEYVHPGTCGTS
ncbi:glycosyltransferase family 39 protein [Streptomyces fulvoviolaceus]|uniref:glycosyltransferase family 39 protein n=1 Tax=Streptomyces fulvoviolaceus TaxID=285535 RepID=UPI0021C1631C|nr:glycosyltransferase family 39 protein [Streptomyces fulvoviolaceus]MCT9084360.1 glycosyltransferase family 39 protein [Streptomyces fulvoviolaceus]